MTSLGRVDLRRQMNMAWAIAESEVLLFQNACASPSPEIRDTIGMKGVLIVNELSGILHTRSEAEAASRQNPG